MIARRFAFASALGAAVLLSASVAAAPLSDVADCERQAMEWIQKAAEGDDQPVFAAAWREHGAAALDDAAVRGMAASAERCAFEEQQAKGASLREAEPWGSRQTSPTSLYVMGAERRVRGATPWVVVFVRLEEGWKLAQLTNGPTAERLAPRFFLAVDARGEIGGAPLAEPRDYTLPRIGPPPEALKTPADCQAALLPTLKALAAADEVAGPVQEAYRALGIARWNEEQLRSRTVVFHGHAEERRKLGGRLPGEVECVGCYRMGDAALGVSAGVPFERGPEWWWFQFQLRDGGWKLVDVSAGAAAEAVALTLAMGRSVEWRGRRFPPVGAAGNRPSPKPRAEDAAALSKAVAAAAEEMAQGKFDRALPALLAKTLEPGKRHNETDASRAERFAAVQRSLDARIGPLNGRVDRIGRITWGERWTAELFSLERAEGGRPWAVVAYRPHDAWRPAKIEEGPDAYAYFGPAVYRALPAWREGAAEERPRFDDRFAFDRALATPEVLLSEKDCLAASGDFARSAGRRPEEAVRLLMKSRARPTSEKELDPLVQEAVRRIRNEQVVRGALIPGGVECLGCVLRGPSRLAALFLARQEKGPLCISVAFHRPTEAWEATAVDVGDAAFGDCSWAWRRARD